MNQDYDGMNVSFITETTTRTYFASLLFSSAGLQMIYHFDFK